MKIGIFYGSTSGNTESAAKQLAELLGDAADVHEVSNIDGDRLAQCDLVILGASTWGAGDLQDDMADALESVKAADLKGKKAAVFGLGDQDCYADTFVDGMADMAEALQAAGAEIIGAWPTAGYDFISSRAAEGDSFVGLVLDEDNQPELSQERLGKWAEQLKG